MNLLLIFLIILTFTYIKCGLLVLISIVIWLIVFILSNLLLGLDPNNKEMFIIRILSILIIIFILYYNSIEHTISSSLLIPFSVTKISFLEDLLNEDQNYNYDIIYFRKPNLIWLKFGDFIEIMNVLSLLQDNKAYVATFDLILDQSGFEFADPTIKLGPPLLISKDSNPWLISKYLVSKVSKACNSFDLNDQNEVSILLKYKEIKVFED